MENINARLAYYTYSREFHSCPRFISVFRAEMLRHINILQQTQDKVKQSSARNRYIFKYAGNTQVNTKMAIAGFIEIFFIFYDANQLPGQPPGMRAVIVHRFAVLPIASLGTLRDIRTRADCGSLLVMSRA